MKRHIIIIIVTAASIAWTQPAAAQTIVDALQKQILPEATVWNRYAWENLMPAGNQDTVFYTATAQAEHVILNEAGLPAEITQLTRQDGAWLPRAKTFAYFGTDLNLRLLETWTWQQGAWVPASSTERTMDTRRNVSTYAQYVWANENWVQTLAVTTSSTLCARVDTVKP